MALLPRQIHIAQCPSARLYLRDIKNRRGESKLQARLAGLGIICLRAFLSPKPPIPTPPKGRVASIQTIVAWPSALTIVLLTRPVRSILCRTTRLTPIVYLQLRQARRTKRSGPSSPTPAPVPTGTLPRAPKFIEGNCLVLRYIDTLVKWQAVPPSMISPATCSVRPPIALLTQSPMAPLPPPTAVVASSPLPVLYRLLILTVLTVFLITGQGTLPLTV